MSYRSAAAVGQAAEPAPEAAAPTRSDKAGSGSAWPDQPVKVVAAVLAAILLLMMVFMPAPVGLKPEAFRVLLAMGVAMCLWLPEVFPPSFSAVLMVFLLPFTGALGLEEAVASLGNRIIWLLMSVSFLTSALTATGLDRRFAYSIVRQAGGRSAMVLLSIIATGFFSTFVVPNAESRTALLVTLATGLLRALGVKPLHSNLGRGLLLATSLTSLLSSVVVITGASAVIWAAGYFESVLGFSWSYGSWLLVMLPGGVLICLAIWLVILWLYPPEQAFMEDGLNFVKDELRKMGPLAIGERKLLGLLALLFALLLVGGRFGISRDMSFMAVALLLFLPGIGVSDWNVALKKVPWGTLLFFASSLTLSRAVVTSGAADWVAQQMVGVVTALPSWFMTIGVMLLFLLLRFVFTNMSSVLSALMPVVTSLSLSTGRNPVWLSMIAVVASTLCIITPMQSASNIMAYSAGYYEMRDLAKVGTVVSIIVIATTLLVSHVYWPLFGLHP